MIMRLIYGFFLCSLFIYLFNLHCVLTLLLLESIASSRSRLRLSFSVLDHVKVFDDGKGMDEGFAWELEQFLRETAGKCRTSLVLHILVVHSATRRQRPCLELFTFPQLTF